MSKKQDSIDRLNEVISLIRKKIANGTLYVYSTSGHPTEKGYNFIIHTQGNSVKVNKN